MSDKFPIRTVREVYNKNCGGCITVLPDLDDNGLVSILTAGTDAEMFGKADLTITKEMAAALGKALIAASQD